MAYKSGRFARTKRCRFCRDKIDQVDYKDFGTLQKLCTAQGKLFSRKRSGTCAFHQRSLKQAAKRARFVALIEYVA